LNEFFEARDILDDAAGLFAAELSGEVPFIISDLKERMAETEIGELSTQLQIIEDVGGFFPAGDLVERWLGDEDVFFADEVGHLPEEEGKEEGANV